MQRRDTKKYRQFISEQIAIGDIIFNELSPEGQGFAKEVERTLERLQTRFFPLIDQSSTGEPTISELELEMNRMFTVVEISRIVEDQHSDIMAYRNEKNKREKAKLKQHLDDKSHYFHNIMRNNDLLEMMGDASCRFTGQAIDRVFKLMYKRYPVYARSREWYQGRVRLDVREEVTSFGVHLSCYNYRLLQKKHNNSSAA